MKHISFLIFCLFILTSYSFSQDRILQDPEYSNYGGRGISNFSVSPDGKILAYKAIFSRIRIYDIEKQKFLTSINIDESAKATSVSFSPDGKYLAWINENNNISTYDISNNKFDIIKMECISFKFSPIGNILVILTGGDNWWSENFRLFDIKSKSIIRNIFNDHNNRNFDLSSDGNSILVANGTNINVCSYFPKVSCYSTDIKSQYYNFIFSNNNKYAMIYGVDLFLWNLNENKLEMLTNYAYYGVDEYFNCCFPPLDKYLVYSSSKDHKIYFSSFDGAAFTSVKIDEMQKQISFTQDGKYLLSLDDKGLKFWEAKKLLPYTGFYTKYYDMYYKDYQNDLSAVFDKSKTKDEFETQQEYEARIADAFASKKSIDEKYYTLFSNLVNNDIGQQNAEIDKKDAEIQDKINKSIESAETKINAVGTYEIENELLPVTINGVTEKVKIKRDDAKTLKEHFGTAVVKGKKRLKYDLKNYEFFELIIIHPISNTEYKFGNW